MTRLPQSLRFIVVSQVNICPIGGGGESRGLRVSDAEGWHSKVKLLQVQRWSVAGGLCSSRARFSGSSQTASLRYAILQYDAVDSSCLPTFHLLWLVNPCEADLHDGAHSGLTATWRHRGQQLCRSVLLATWQLCHLNSLSRCSKTLGFDLCWCSSYQQSIQMSIHLLLLPLGKCLLSDKQLRQPCHGGR